MLSLHTSPLAQPGAGDSGGMNVYVRELAAALAHQRAQVTVYVRRWSSGLAAEVEVEPGVRVVHVDAGRPELSKEELYDIVDPFTDGVLADIDRVGADVLHANYWLSGEAGHRIKHARGIPLVSTFHTLARVKAELGDYEPQRRVNAELDVVRCSDVVTASCHPEAQQLERLYHAEPERIEYVAPGVDHAIFSPGDQAGARRAIGVGPGPMLLFVGRIQPLKGVDVAVRALAALRRPDAKLVIVGGASGREGSEEVARIHEMVDALGLVDQVIFRAPQPHHLLSSYYRAADLTLVPSRSESFGLVALESAACGTPVIAAAVGGLRTLVDHGRTGFLIEGRDPTVFAAYIDEVLANPMLAASMAMNAAERAARYRWSGAATHLVEVYRGLVERAPELVSCS
jgi:D-inositol-3-phosphate glycosyltransferase